MPSSIDFLGPPVVRENFSSLKAMPLPGGRVVLLDGKGVAILDAATLVARGYTRVRPSIRRSAERFVRFLRPRDNGS